MNAFLVGQGGPFFETVAAGLLPGFPLFGGGVPRIRQPEPAAISGRIALGGKDSIIPQAAVPPRAGMAPRGHRRNELFAGPTSQRRSRQP